MKPRIERFLTKYEIDETTGCWEWTAARYPNGYPQFRYRTGLTGYGHRFAYEHFVGPIPTGLQLDHLCRNRGCVNPSHLEAVTLGENVRRGKAWTRKRRDALGRFV